MNRELRLFKKQNPVKENLIANEQFLFVCSFDLQDNERLEQKM